MIQLTTTLQFIMAPPHLSSQDWEFTSSQSQPELPPLYPRDQLASKATKEARPREVYPQRMLQHALRKNKAPPIPPSKSFLFGGISPLYSRDIVEGVPTKMLIQCTQMGCTTFLPKIISRHLSGTNNFKPHYMKYHPHIPLSESD